MIEVVNLYKKYGKAVAIDHISFHVNSGEIYGFLGPNGAGKSTTMNILSGYIGPTEGSVMIDGVDMQKEPEKAKEKIGYMPEILPLYSDMRVHEYLTFVANLKKVDKKIIKDHINELVNKTNLHKQKNILIRNLSKGYQLRVGLAQAMVGYPKLIILDEPTSGLDPKQAVEVRKLIRSMKKDHTVLISSHNLEEIQEICDKIIIMNHGKLIASDTSEELAKKCGNKRVISMTVKGSREDICNILDHQEYVLSYSFADEYEVCLKYVVEVTVDENDEIRDQVFYAFAEQKLPILEMNMGYESLEDIFLKLTEGE